METKPGYLTTEFWMAVIASLLGVASATGIFTPDQASELSQALTKIMGLLSPVLISFGYSLSRGQAKKGIKPEEGAK